MDKMWFVIILAGVIIILLICMFALKLVYLKNISSVIDNQEYKNVASDISVMNKLASELVNKIESNYKQLLVGLDSVSSKMLDIRSTFGSTGKSTVDILNSVTSGVSSIGKTIMPDPKLPLSDECMLSEECLASYLSPKLLSIAYTNANTVTEQGSASLPSVLQTKRVYFGNGIYYENFFMPMGVDNELLFLEVRSTASVTVNTPRSDLLNNLKVKTNTIAVFMYKKDKWCFVTVLPASQLL